MSNQTPNVTTLPEPSEKTETVEEKQSFVTKTKHFVKSHKRPAIAVGALVGLVAVAAVTGRKTADPTIVIVDSEDLEEMLTEESTDTESA